MSENQISADFPFEMKRMKTLDSEMAYVDVGEGDPVVFLHGNPTSSYMWRNVIPYAQENNRCLAPDLIGMGQSGKSLRYGYKFMDHVKYMDAWFEQLALKNIILVVHDWGAALGFYRACRYPEMFAGIVYMEAMVRPRYWSDLPEGREPMFRKLRGPEGEQMVLRDNFFVEKMLFEFGTLRDFSEEEKAVYRAPYADNETSRVPTLLWPREIVFDGDPDENHAPIKQYSDWLANSTDMPKLFVNADQGHGTAGAAREFCRQWPNQREVTLHSKHYVAEDAPHELGKALAEFISEVRS
ncbi:haloalkane dehalogenase [Roseibium sp. MMSF_3544]|uniref:haloalkane dehalogenase n=1 Tax=unclassified Roseibium TaxID=2629323 RepID=UPI00273D968D|nr:haloalkane dehalogenase [Roseibium sp. MMSF_3544]